MTGTELQEVQEAVLELLTIESSGRLDRWTDIEQLSLALIGRINREKIDVPEDIYHYLDDFDIRRRDEAYGEFQRRRVRDILISKDNDYS